MKPLQGIRVLDLSRLLPGPYCTMLLADLGAEIVKIETPGLGDYLRVIPPYVLDATGTQVSALFQLLNRNKQSVALNFRNPRGKEVLSRLAKTADVLVESFRPGAPARWGIGYEQVRALNPRLVYCSLSGYGQSGPYRDRAGHDLNYLALSGLLAVNGVADGPPIPPGAQIADLSSAMLATTAILAALIGRAQTGAGQYLDIGLFDGALSWAGTIVGATYAAGEKTARGKMQLNGGMACYNVYATRDGKHVALAAIEPHLWASFCKAVGREDLIARAQEFAAVSEVAAIVQTRTLAEWIEFAKTVDACIEPVREFGETLNDPHAKARGLIAEIGGIKQIGSVFTFADVAPTPAPRQGQHTRAVLRAIGMSDAEIGELERGEVIKISD
ncbi:MAG: CoA transferase [Anaerolineales bacterium]|nr:CoA transferase [Anaerolineales bacterium]